ncbi:hypothetical protein NC653_035746 [Populus alba x Populus x berolinensis]|uniref:Uncharacterized protein n=1 Tax=Populus alba x Populus x berolinensis TaxID=444605 RepID=A0AAD6LI37_9ROSI|nr:hypothetical protein NC653_035746 [Populus alba x Populus x berolinensis]
MFTLVVLVVYNLTGLESITALVCVVLFYIEMLRIRCKSIGQSAGRIWPPLCSPVVRTVILILKRNTGFHKEKAPDRITQAVESRGWSRSYYLLHFYEARQL